MDDVRLHVGLERDEEGYTYYLQLNGCPPKPSRGDGLHGLATVCAEYAMAGISNAPKPLNDGAGHSPLDDCAYNHLTELINRQLESAKTETG